jgi:galactose mutarotase-like enzyme
VGETITITSGSLTATIAHHGAELQSLKDADGNEYMSSGDPAYWSGRAPLLFPIVGRLNEDRLRLGDANYTMLKHGFARKSHFSLINQSENAVRFRLSDSTETRAQYPFAFALDAHFRIDGNTLHMTVTARNTGGTDLPFSFGYHPAFAWPLPGGGARGDHQISFEADEPAALFRLTLDGLITPDTVPTPVTGNQIALADALFEQDALIWKSLVSRRLFYGAPGHAALDIAFPDTDWLGIWTKPGAGFVCIEPWAGVADPVDYNDDFNDKPGVIVLAPRGERQFRMNVTLVT